MIVYNNYCLISSLTSLHFPLAIVARARFDPIYNNVCIFHSTPQVIYPRHPVTEKDRFPLFVAYFECKRDREPPADIGNNNHLQRKRTLPCCCISTSYGGGWLGIAWCRRRVEVGGVCGRMDGS